MPMPNGVTNFFSVVLFYHIFMLYSQRKKQETDDVKQTKFLKETAKTKKDNVAFFCRKEFVM